MRYSRIGLNIKFYVTGVGQTTLDRQTSANSSVAFFEVHGLLGIMTLLQACLLAGH
jgi:hypothetical protein